MYTDDDTWYPSPTHLTWLPEDISLQDIFSHLSLTGVYAPAEYVDSLQEQISLARNKGIDLLVVYFPEPKMISRTLLRDIADYVEHSYHKTVLVMDPHIVGAASPNYPRVTIERSERQLPLTHPDAAVAQFVQGLQKPEFPWDITVFFLFLCALICVYGNNYIVSKVLRLVQLIRVKIRVRAKCSRVKDT